MALDKRDIDKMEMFNLLGKIYCKTACGYAKLGLRSFITGYGGETLQGKYNYIIKAIRRSGLLIPGEKLGRSQAYKWNMKKFGPVSIAIAEMIVAETENQARIRQREYYHRHKNDAKKT